LNEGILASSSKSVVSTANSGTRQEVSGVAVWAVVFPHRRPGAFAAGRTPAFRVCDAIAALFEADFFERRTGESAYWITSKYDSQTRDLSQRF
jgi:hypothetical protein